MRAVAGRGWRGGKGGWTDPYIRPAILSHKGMESVHFLMPKRLLEKRGQRSRKQIIEVK
jgi:hypothetical protein